MALGPASASLALSCLLEPNAGPEFRKAFVHSSENLALAGLRGALVVRALNVVDERHGIGVL